MADIVNPYIAGAPVTEQRMFFGREDIFQWIENSIAGRYADHILVVHGQRRVGKTSVLKQLGNRLPERYIPVFFDLQGRTHTTLDHFLWWLARETVRVLKQERGVEVPIPEKDDFARDPEYFENAFLPGLGPSLGDNSLLYTFDEFDNLEESDVKEELARPLTDYLRRLMGRGEMNFIFSIGSSGRKLENMQAAYTEFFKTALYKKISFLSKEQTHGLVTRPVEGVLEYERAAVERIYRITSGHPYFTQLTCHELFARCQSTQQRKIAVADVESVLDDVVERGTVNLKFVWDEASDIEKWSLAALAHLDKADNRALADYLRKNRVRFSESDLTSGLLHLREKDVLTSQNQFVIHLLKLWLQKNRPIEQVREELTEANPIASRFIEIGLEFRDGGQHDKAIEYFRQALSISADNLQAQVNIALVYAAQGQLEQAVIEFEKALAIDDEDVASRAGLCDAHLALGDAAMKRGRAKDAIVSYQRVLAFNAEHLEARQRMAEICRQRGEKALTDGRDEEALNAFTEALKYTPEDAALLARVEKVRAEKKAKVLAAQVARSEKEAAARNWDKAIDALNEALETAPGDQSILKKIEAIKAKKLQEQLSAILAKVEAAEKTGRWDTAIAGLNEYLRLNPEDAVIQKRLADLIEARRAAWLKGVMTRVDQAVAAQNWDEALTALNEALRLEPENAELQARAGGVRAARRTAELEAMLERADQAAGANRWDEVIQVLNDGLAADPGNDTLKTKLAEARKAKREARLQAALRLADSAAQAGKWETAAASLQEVLVNEPDNPEFIQKLAEIKRLERESRLGGLESLAKTLLEAEKFDEALTAWEEYLALLPADRDKAQAEIAAVKKAQTLASLYAEATQAHAKKNYEKAIELFKRIVVEDADYKDTTDLLAEAVRLRRAGSKAPRTFNRKAWLTGGLVLLLALGLGAAILWVGKNGLPAMPAFSQDNTATPASVETGSTSTVAETSALAPELQAALATIRNAKPLYHTSFDDWDTDDTDPNAALVDGKLVLTGEDGNWTYFHLNTYPSDRYVVEYEINIPTSNGICLYGAGNGLPLGESYRGFTMEFLPGEDLAVLARYVPESGLDVRLATASFDKTKSNMVTLVVLGDQITAFIDGQLAYTALNHAGSVVYVEHGFAAPNQATCEFDYFKYWDLREMDSAVKSALATIQNEEPLYQTSFDSWESWASHGTTKVENGKLIVASENQQHAGMNLYNLISDKYAVQFDLRVLDISSLGHCIFESTNNLEYGEPDYRGLSAGFFSDGNAIPAHYIHPDRYEDFEGAIGKYDLENSNAVTLIILGDQIAAFIDGSLAYTVLDPDGSAVFTSQALSAYYTAQCEYDNFKIWDLRGVDFSAATTTSGPTSSFASILDSIAGKTPAFEDDFSNLASGWSTQSDAIGETGYQDGAYFISAKDDCYGAPLPTHQKFSNFVLEMDVRFINQGQGTVSIMFRDIGSAHFGVNLSPQGWVGFHKNVNGGHIPLLETEIPASSFRSWDTSKRLTLIARQERMAIYVNRELFIALADTSSSQGWFNFAVCSDTSLQALIDNLKIWDITDLSP
ncbi:MAG: tetratricopeptide repeat protein [Chloroflexota bacterium]